MFLIIGVVLGCMTYISWMSFYWIYLPRSIRHWFEASMGRLFILDFALTIVGIVGFSSISDSLTAVIAASTLGLLGTLTTLGIRGYQSIKSKIRVRELMIKILNNALY
jgi:hypothetical protein